ncbi:hypothetical protein HQ489_02075 [Candidatus Woesearchaeota archaeon]|nr:hypothetical protein [Candidatus Woesearchaeota archaeon]
MDPELIEEFFKCYLDENHLKYAVNQGIYTVTLDKKHQKWYDLKKCTFDPLLAKGPIQLIQPGNFIFDSMVCRYADVVVSNLRIPDDHDHLFAVNEKLVDLNKGSVTYNISEEREIGTYIFFEIIVNTANRKQIFSLPMIVIGKRTFLADNFLKADFELVQEKFKVQGVDQALGDIELFIGKDLVKAENEQDKDMKDLREIQHQHAEDQYSELQSEENKMLDRINSLENDAGYASTFSSKNRYMAQAKSLRKKHMLLIKKNQSKRQEIKGLFDKQINELETRELQVEAKIVALAKVDFPYLLVTFADGDEFYYFPFLETFEKK